MSRDRKGSYMRAGTRATGPGVLFSIAVMTNDHRNKVNPAITNRTFCRAVALVGYWRRGKWTSPQEATFTTPDALFEWMREREIRRKTNWVVCPIASEVLTLTHWWDYAKSKGVLWRSSRRSAERPGTDPDSSAQIVFGSLVTKGTPDIIGYADGGVTYRWVSGYQYLPAGPLGRRDVEPVRGGDSPSGVVVPVGSTDEPASVAREWWRSIAELSSWWRENANAPWGHTCGALAVGMLRSNLTTNVPCTHNDADAHRLERDGAFGGRASLWYAGQVGDCGVEPMHVHAPDGNEYIRRVDGPVTLLDVASMYASIMRDRAFPTKLLSYREDVPPNVPQDVARSLGVVACVTIRTRAAEYPCLRDGRIVYPVGQFTTTLTGPELVALQDDGEVIRCHRMAVYEMGHALTRVAERLLALRTEAATAGRAGYESFAKLLGNSLAGKFAQNRGRWTRDTGADSLHEWGEHWKLTAESGELLRLRYIAGFAWRWLDDETGAGPFTAIYDYIAAYCRVVMRSVRECCPPRSVISQDTDGVWVLPPALEALASLWTALGSKPGELRVVRTARTGIWFGPRHYSTDGTWTLAGFSSPFVAADGRTVVDEVATPLWESLDSDTPQSVSTLTRRSRLRLTGISGSIGPDGWAIPLYLPPSRLEGEQKAA